MRLPSTNPWPSHFTPFFSVFSRFSSRFAQMKSARTGSSGRPAVRPHRGTAAPSLFSQFQGATPHFLLFVLCRIHHSRDGGRQPFPLRGFGEQLLAPGPGKAVKLGSAVILRGSPG